MSIENHEEDLIIEDFTYVEDLDLILFTTSTPKTSTIFVKHTKDDKRLLAMLQGHKSDEAPCILYVENSGCLISGERYKSALSGMFKECEIIIWNL